MDQGSVDHRKGNGFMNISSLSLVMYICFLIPMLLALFVLEKRERLVVGYILAGATVCILLSKANTVLYRALGQNMLYFVTTVSPITEEIGKALPVLVFAFLISSERVKLEQISFVEGLGFAIMENMILFTQNLSECKYGTVIFVKDEVSEDLSGSLFLFICAGAHGEVFRHSRMRPARRVWGKKASLILDSKQLTKKSFRGG